MNKEYVLIDGKAIIEDEKGNKYIEDYSDKTEEILIQKNLIETMENRIKELEKELKETKEDNKPHIPYIFLAVLLGLVTSIPMISGLAGIDLLKVSNTIFGPMNEYLIILVTLGITVLPPTILIELLWYKQDKHEKNSRRGDASEYEYLTKRIVKEREKLEQLELEQVKTDEIKGFQVRKVDDLEILKNLRSWLILYNDLGYNGKKYYKYLKQGKLDGKLNEYYTELGIEAAKGYLEEKGPSLVKRKNINKNK